ncbi:MAG: hypothetical protein EVJ46_06360 [Candidatus Acididesulfobacter guangdongensis]|uniref:Uncharacterized protein n=1 Tax=Acididesulfobacter guangdongensis TaxID=2597225 RepID=A0A519BH77_ACIG2|nr:MAG: hypothetical protein EVJ46_06360 [Candidatus Acididesulfobacter guangdongensis]
MDINDIIEEGQEERGQREPEGIKPKRKNKIKFNKKLLLIVSVIVLIGGAAAYFLLFKSSRPIIPVTGRIVTPPVNQSFLFNKTLNNKIQNKISNPSLKSTVESNASVTDLPIKNKTAQPVKGKAASKVKKANNTLNDLFTVKYKHKAKKTNMQGVPNMPPNANVPNVPAIPFNQNLPNFNLKGMASKIKNMQGLSSGSSFNVSGYSGGYVIAECGKSTKYLKAGQSACGYTLLKANSNDATFSHNGKFKKISY